MLKIKAFHCIHCAKLNYIPMTESAWRERVPALLAMMAETISPWKTADLIARGRERGMWLTASAGSPKLYKMAEEELIQRQGHGWWAITETGRALAREIAPVDGAPGMHDQPPPV
jgi:hypothetical protein